MAVLARRHRWIRATMAGVTAALLLPALTAMALPPSSGGSRLEPNHLRPAPAQRPVPVRTARFRRVPVPVNRPWHAPAVRWPSAGTGVAEMSAQSPAVRRGVVAAARIGGQRANAVLAGQTDGSARAGSEPVWIGPALHGATSSARRVRVGMQSRRLAAELGVSGVVFTLAQAGTASAATSVHVSLDYSGFAYADGGGFASRLHLVELPACALTTPAVAACRRQVPVTSGDDLATDQLGADVRLPAAMAAATATPGSSGRSAVAPAAAAGAVVVMAATTAPSGSGGSFSATPLSDDGTWSAGGSSGAFTYSYPITVPPVPGGLEPQISLDYDSQSVDGLTSSTNDQASWIGDGWDYSPGYIERDYEPCSQTSANTGDLCWSGNNVTTLSLGGVTTTLIQDSTTGTWQAENDQGDTVTYETGSGSNGTHDDDYWVVTDPTGTSYYFGLNELPGYASGDTQTDSAWTVPVYATASGQPCYNATFADSHCLQAWRWNLDYVTDADGNASAYFYNSETNYYAADNGTTATAAYTQAGVVSKIEYGLRAGSIYGVTPAGEVNFTAPATRTDIPTGSSGDLACSSGAACDVQSPTFWGKYQLTTISTEGLEGSTLEPADSWALMQDYPATGDSTTPASLWLESITRTGEDGGSVSLPSVSFAGIGLANRAETPADESDGYSLITRFRISDVTNEMGGTTEVTYDTVPTSCTSGNFPSPDDNTTLCYPDYWTPPGASSPVEDWFNKYVVMAVTQVSTEVSSQAEYTTYCYGTSSSCMSGAAWHFDDDPLQKSSERTWDQWRGFGQVTTETGVAPDPVSETVDTYFQGMNGDYQSGGGSTSASLSTTIGGVQISATDSNQWAGMDFEHAVYDGAGGALVSATVTTPYTSAAMATQSGLPSPLPDLQAYMTGSAETQTFTALASGGYREADEYYTHDSQGRVTVDEDVPDAYDDGVAGQASEDTCTQTSYPSSGNWDLPSEIIVTGEPPASCPVSGTPAQSVLVSDTRYYYDGSTTLGAEPTKGTVTETTEATSYSGSSEVFTVEDQKSYDEYGRVTSDTNADGDTTTSSYSPATGAEPTTVTVTSPATANAPDGLVTTTTYDPLRDLPLTVTDPAGAVTTNTYDALGRLTAVWTPGHPSASDPADETFSYDVSNTGPTVITTDTITATGSYNPSEDLYDSLGRLVETQTETPDGGRDVTDYTFNSDGWPLLDAGPYYTTGVPSGTLVDAAEDQVPDETGYFYDGTGRVVRQVLYDDATELWETDTSYGGNYTTVTPPAGGTATTTYINGDGQTSYVYDYHSAAPPATPPAPGSGSESGSSGWDQTAYSYNAAQELTGITDDAGNPWSDTYYLAGEVASANTPDTGTTSYTYDPDGNLLSVTDARGKTISYAYDADGRKIAEYDTTGGAAESGSDELASWTYDTLAKGLLTSSTAYDGGTSGSAYTESVIGYNSYELPTGTETVIPSAAGALAGTYKQGDTYSAYGDELASYYDYAAGGLPAETVDIGYNTSDEPVSAGSSLWDYVSGLSYTEFGQPEEYAFGTTTEPAWLTNSYNQSTGQLTNAAVQTGTTPVTVDDLAYGYDNDGLITSESDTPSGGPDQVQCFTYNYLGQLSSAWAQGTTGCASSGSQSAEAGAAAPYYEQYSYNDEGDLTSEVSTPASGAATTYTNTFPAAGSAQPHAITSQEETVGSGSPATTSYAYTASGQTDSITTAGTTSNLAWNDAGQLTSITPSGSSTATASYVYDADGNLLIQSDPAAETSTLYLPDEEIIDTDGTLSAVRYYTIGGVTVAARSSGGTIYYLTGDSQGTDDLAINSSTLAVTRRYYDPYGNPIGTPPATWPGNKGFVGGTTDPNTGLVNLGAREYNPATASFISTDALLNPYQPTDLNPYAYAQDDPATNSDPSGLMICMAGGGCASLQYWEAHPQASQSQQTVPDPDSTAVPDDCPPQICGHLAPELAMETPAAAPIRTVTPKIKSTGTFDAYSCGRFGLGCSGFSAAAAASRSSGGGSLPSWLLWGGAAVLTVINIAQLGADPATDALEAADITAATADTVAESAAEDASTDVDADAATCGGMSFSAGTKVLLASGAAIPISQLKPGDKVLSTNVRTGKTSAEPVSAVLVHYDTDRYDLRISAAHGAAIIQTTSSHLFWDPASHRWVKAAALGHGSHLSSGGSAAVTILGGYAPKAKNGWMWDLSVPGGGDHDFYIDVATTAVLVHNCDDPDPDEQNDQSRGSTGRTTPGGANEARAMEYAKQYPQYGDVLPVNMSDPNWLAEDGWVKMSQTIDDVEIHYVYNYETEMADDFKFKDWDQ
jgi:RHS repeat-associated protein